MRPRLFTPGPTQISERVLNAMAQPMQHHRSPEFKQFFVDTSDMLKQFFKTKNDVLTITSSGSGGMEGAVINFLSKGEKVIVIEGGKFGERWREISHAYGLNVVSLKVTWGEAIDPNEVKKALQEHPDARAVMLTHSETSTGVAFDVKEIAKITREHSDALTIIDGITSVGVLPFYMDDWGIDICVSGSQKGVMIPPGLAFVAVSDRAWERAEKSDLPKYYFDFKKARKSLADSTTPWTPATSLIIGLNESLKMFLEAGHQYFWTKYAALSHATMEGMKAVNLELFAKTPSNALTAVKVPDSLDGQKFVKLLREKYKITVAGGQSQLKGKIFRVAHMGYYDHLDMVSFASAMEMALRDSGWDFEIGKAVAMVQKAYVNFHETTGQV